MTMEQEIYYALKGLHFAITDKSDEQFKGQNEAYLKIVAIPRANEILEKYKDKIKEFK
jgi:hypothetical protein